MSAQTSYSRLQAVAYAGMIYALAPRDIASRAAEGDIAFGIAVSRGSDPDTQVVPGGATGFMGISVRALDQEGVANTGAIQYDDEETVAVMRSGYIWAVCPTGCVPGDVVNYVDATGVLDSGAAVAGETSLDNAQWETTTAAGEIGLISLTSQPTTAGV